MVQLIIDNKKISTEPDKTVLQAAHEAGIYIPSLCFHPDLPPLSTCRLCIVQIEGVRGFPTSCNTKVRDGMVVKTNTPEIQEMRKQLLWLIFSELPEDMPKSTELMKIAEYIGFEEVLAGFAPKAKELPILSDEPLFIRDYNRCVLCGRCVEICDNVRGVGVLGFVDRGINSRVTTAYDENYVNSACAFCGACVEVCPSGALTEKKEVDPEDREKTLLPCSYNCPAHIDVPEYVRLIAEGRFQDSLEIIRETVPFPHILGLVCDHPCETECRRGELQGSISIRNLKRFVAEKDNGRWRSKLKIGKDTGKKVAVVGGGPSGLSAAWFLKLKGHSVTVFEANKTAGGMMASGIPKYRLPWSVLNKEIKEIKNIGVEIKLNSKVESISDLKKNGFDAVFLGIGAQLGMKMGLPGEDDHRVKDGIAVLKAVNFGEEFDLSGKVAVVGGGNVAMDVARTALRNGADEVTVLYRRTKAQMPADPEEVEEAENEGAVFNFLVNPIKIIPGKDHLTVECIRMELGEPDSSGRRRPVPVEGSEFTVDVDHLIIAIGQDYVIPDEFNLELERWGTIKVNEDMSTSREGVYAGGDVVTGPASVIKAIAAGTKAASSIDKYLGGDGEMFQKLVPEEEWDPWMGRREGFGAEQRVKMKTIPVEERKKNPDAQVDICFTDEEAVNEAKRCLKCPLRLEIHSAPVPENFMD
ncbi:ferredoxin [candidate division KSB1 bacterium]|nr:MAG: ferredoxin [candidate division KSB1 bacterium]